MLQAIKQFAYEGLFVSHNFLHRKFPKLQARRKLASCGFGVQISYILLNPLQAAVLVRFMEFPPMGASVEDMNVDKVLHVWLTRRDAYFEGLKTGKCSSLSSPAKKQ